MATAGATSLSELARFGFVDLSLAVKKLDQLVSLVGDSGRSALAPLGRVADPDQALNALIEFATADSQRIRKLLSKRDSATSLCSVLGASSAMIDFLRRHPSEFVAFESASSLQSMSEYRSDAVQAIAADLARADFGAACNTLRFTYRQQLLRIVIFDLAQPSPTDALPTVAAALSDIAGAALEAAIAIARAELSESSDHGIFQPAEVVNTRFAVIAMGKCGARELNYISDVDVIFVAESGDSSLSSERALDISTKLATRMMRAIDGVSGEPGLWQVDPNLRPEGKSGALVRTLASHIAYYDRWAESWEFQALLKARFLAGDEGLGNDYVNALNPKVWTSTTRPNFVESAQKMRQRVTDFIPDNEVDRQIKLGPGGLRDVEFTVQLLQMVHGRSDESVRQRDTLSGLNALAIAGYVGRAEANAFSQHYRFLRLLEHRIQLSQMRRTHLMPTSEVGLRALARSVDASMTATALTNQWEAVKLEVRSLHQKLFYRPLLTAVSRLDDSKLELSSDQAQDRLRAIGFVDPKGALEHISALSIGLSRRAAIQKQLLPVLIEWFADGSDPDAALLAFRRLSEDLGESPWYLRMLRDSSGAAQRMTQVLSNSRLATDLFERIPEAAAWFDRAEDLTPITKDELATEIDATLARHTDVDQAMTAIRGMRRRETLRVAMGAVLGDLSLDQVSQGLSDITEAYLQAVLRAVLQFVGPNLAKVPLDHILDFGIIAMGRFGGQELGFGSDADVMFVYDVMPEANPDEAQKVAERIIGELTKLSSDRVLEFELDTDLRPEGKNGVIVRSLSSYAAYYERWANTWESQALLRARPISGSFDLKQSFTELISMYRYPSELPTQALVDIRRLKARVETERLPKGADPKRHLKLGPGAITDVEWLVQVLQLQWGFKFADLRTGRTLQALQASVAHGLIAEHDARVLEEAWLLASRVRSASVLASNKRTDVLPLDRKQLEGLARILEYPRFSASALEQDYLAFTRRARMVFERLFYG